MQICAKLFGSARKRWSSSLSTPTPFIGYDRTGYDMDITIGQLSLEATGGRIVQAFGPGTGSSSDARGTSSGSSNSAGRGRGRGRAVAPQSLPQSGSKDAMTSQKAQPKLDVDVKSDQPFSNTPFCKRPGKGSSGIPIALLANHFTLAVSAENLKLWEYRVEITVEPKFADGKPCYRKLDRDETKHLFEKFMEHHAGFFPDNPQRKVFFLPFHLAYSLVQLEYIPPQQFTYGGLDAERQRKRELVLNVTVVETAADPITFDNFREIFESNPGGRNDRQLLALQGILKHVMGHNDSFVPVGRNFLYNSFFHRLGSGRVLHGGFYGSIQITDNWKPVLIFDVKTAAIYEPVKATQFANDVLGFRGNLPRTLNRTQVSILEKDLKGLRFKTEYNGHKFRCSGIVNTSAKDMKIEVDGKKMSVADYFGLKHNIILQYPGWPMLQKANKSCFPMEISKIEPNQRVPMKKITAQQQSDWIKKSAVPPDQRLQFIQQTMDDAINHDVKKELNNNFNMSISLRLTKVQGRTLPSPQLKYQGKKPVDPKNGSWNMATNRVIKPGRTVKKWAILILCYEREFSVEAGRRLGEDFARNCIRMGMTNMEKKPADNFVRQIDPSEIRAEMARLAQAQIDFALVLLNDAASEFYNDVKYYADSVSDVMTECMKLKTVRRCNEQIFSNVGLKLNARLGGVNQFLEGQKFSSEAKFFLQEKPIMLMGADVSHPDSGDKWSPSIAGVCASMDLNPFQYKGVAKAQEHRKEVIVGLELVVKNFLLSFYQRNKNLKPSNIVYFRDGVSESYFTEVFSTEIRAIRAACSRLEKTYKPAITFIVVSRGHNTRLFREKMQPNAKNPDKNIPAGATVDEKIVHPHLFDFFLCSHQGIQGTSVPAHYYVLHDDSELSSNAVQELVYHLCYTYAKATKSISTPPPVYYADDIAERGSQHLKAFLKYSHAFSQSTLS